jgi:hypothetical protein
LAPTCAASLLLVVVQAPAGANKKRRSDLPAGKPLWLPAKKPKRRFTVISVTSKPCVKWARYTCPAHSRSNPSPETQKKATIENFRAQPTRAARKGFNRRFFELAVSGKKLCGVS